MASNQSNYRQTKTWGNTVPYISIDGVKTYNPKKISNAFRSFYANLGSDLAKKIQNRKTSIDEYINMIPCNLNSLALRQTNEKEIRTLISQLPNKSSSGHDHISNKLLEGILTRSVSCLCCRKPRPPSLVLIG